MSIIIQNSITVIAEDKLYYKKHSIILPELWNHGFWRHKYHHFGISAMVSVHSSACSIECGKAKLRFPDNF